VPTSDVLTEIDSIFIILSECMCCSSDETFSHKSQFTVKSQFTSVLIPPIFLRTNLFSFVSVCCLQCTVVEFGCGVIFLFVLLL